MCDEEAKLFRPSAKSSHTMDESLVLGPNLEPSSLILRQLYDSLRENDPDVVLQVTESEAQHDSDSSGSRESTSLDARLLQAEVKFLRGVAFGRLGRHDDAFATGIVLQERFPTFPHGSYLIGMSLLAGAADQHGAGMSATDALERAARLDKQLRGEPASALAAERLGVTMKSVSINRHMRAIRKHCTAVNAFVPKPCDQCGTVATITPLRWLCPRCYCQSPRCESLVWEPDAGGTCHCCTTAITSLGTRHHCRSCGRLVCANCSDHTMRVSVLGYNDVSVRVCDACDQIAARLLTRGSSPKRLARPS